MRVNAVSAGPGAAVPPTLAFTSGLLCGWWLNHLARLPLDAAGRGSLQTIAGVAALAIGVAIFLWGLLTFASERTGIMMQEPVRRLITRGPYRWSRNPMYVGLSAGYLGLTLLTNSGWPLVLLPLVLTTVAVGVIAREERYMHAVFGSDYAEYCRRVRRWL
jgi:protein-S-isoprenylcysteine O-methyltransferase Ste14